MKIIATSDWHLGNLFHGNDRLKEHEHFLTWLLEQIKEQQPDALLVAGDVFDNGNPSAAAQEAYYGFLTDATHECPQMKIIITAGNHDSANRLEAPRTLLSRNHIEVRGSVRQQWEVTDNGTKRSINYEDLIIPLTAADGTEAAVLAVPFLRSDVVQGESYSDSVNDFLQTLTREARKSYPGRIVIMMAHMYAKGADIAKNDASEKIVIGGQEEVSMKGWEDHPNYLTCGHIHKRQHIWGTTWARYTGSVLPMSFAEKDYHHGVDMVTFSKDGTSNVEFLEYTPQHQLVILPEDDAELTPNKLKKLIIESLDARPGDKLGDDFKYVMLKVRRDRMKNDDVKMLENEVGKRNAVLCKTQKIMPQLEITTITGGNKVTSIEDILSRDPMDTLKEAFLVKNEKEMSEHQEQMLRNLLENIKHE